MRGDGSRFSARCSDPRRSPHEFSGRTANLPSALRFRLRQAESMGSVAMRHDDVVNVRTEAQSRWPGQDTSGSSRDPVRTFAIRAASVATQRAATAVPLRPSRWRRSHRDPHRRHSESPGNARDRRAVFTLAPPGPRAARGRAGRPPAAGSPVRLLALVRKQWHALRIYSRPAERELGPSAPRDIHARAGATSRPPPGRFGAEETMYECEDPS